MPPLWVFALDSVNELLFGVEDMELLELFSPATTVEYSFLYYFAYVFVFVVDSDLGTIVGGQTNIKIPEPDIRRVIIIVFADDGPGSVAGWDQHALNQTYLLLETKIDVSFITELFIRLV